MIQISYAPYLRVDAAKLVEYSAKFFIVLKRDIGELLGKIGGVGYGAFSGFRLHLGSNAHSKVTSHLN